VNKKQITPKKYSVLEAYFTFDMGLRAFIHFALSNIKTKMVNDAFRERIMLAVTEVNDCEVCSYFHAKIALENGMSNKEIQNLLNGNTETIPEEEATAILFSQHYADTKGHPTKNTWEKLIETYGKIKAFDILAITRMIMLGNVIGIPFSAFMNRLKGKPTESSHLAYELSMMVLPVLFLPISAIHILISELFRIPRIRFNE